MIYAPKVATGLSPGFQPGFNPGNPLTLGYISPSRGYLGFVELAPGTFQTSLHTPES
jgi:hypothetical protein